MAVLVDLVKCVSTIIIKLGGNKIKLNEYYTLLFKLKKIIMQLSPNNNEEWKKWYHDNYSKVVPTEHNKSLVQSVQKLLFAGFNKYFPASYLLKINEIS